MKYLVFCEIEYLFIYLFFIEVKPEVGDELYLNEESGLEWAKQRDEVVNLFIYLCLFL